MRTEPALIIGFIGTLLSLAIAFGVPITDTQTKAILAFVTAAIPFIGSIVIRQNVTPVK